MQAATSAAAKASLPSECPNQGMPAPAASTGASTHNIELTEPLAASQVLALFAGNSHVQVAFAADHNGMFTKVSISHGANTSPTRASSAYADAVAPASGASAASAAAINSGTSASTASAFATGGICGANTRGNNVATNIGVGETLTPDASSQNVGKHKKPTFANAALSGWGARHSGPGPRPMSAAR